MLEIEASWDSQDVWAVIAPTAVGKSLIAQTIARWSSVRGQAANILAPTNILIDQLSQSFPTNQVMHRQDYYQCADHKMSCAEVKETVGHHCKNCVYKCAIRDTKRAPIRLMNYYTYWGHRMYAPVVLFDEAHQLVEMLQDKRDIKLWHRQFNFPTGLKTVADVIQWAQAYLKRQNDARLAEALRQILLVKDAATVTYKTTRSRGQIDVVLHVQPALGANIPIWLWPPNKVQKLILLSATISPHDIQELGLANRRVKYLECSSPIPPDRRPVIYDPSYNMAHDCVQHALPVLVSKIKELLAAHSGKGLIHIPYSLAGRLRDLLPDEPRLLFHDQDPDSKDWALKQFRTAEPETGRVLVASGLYEGVDLPYDAARWQIIAKIPYLSLAEQRITNKAEAQPDWYQWEAIKRVLQAAGRIVRAPDDYGVTYIFDIGFGRLLDRDIHRHVPLFPQFFRDALQDRRKLSKLRSNA